ncbi:nitroreductase family protein [Desulfoscipio sp. XC116]|uniref:nitroreductase family protein n=1 Tax=Desulfoscipio sp. XC116 TaxID=3144975 RepID=UPI00325B5517
MLQQFKTLIEKNRSYRRYQQNFLVDYQVLEDLVSLAGLSASTANKQPLKYVISNKVQTNRQIFSTLAWAAYLKDWPGPAEGEKPSAYIIILGDTGISNNFGVDSGIAAQSILLGAAQIGLGGCILASIQRNKLREALGIPELYEILLVIAIGKPKETVVLETVQDGNIRYWRDSEGRHHVPKRPLKEIILNHD